MSAAQPCDRADHDSMPKNSGPKLNPSATSSNALLALVTTLACEGATVALSVMGKLIPATGLNTVAGSPSWEDPTRAWSAGVEAGASSM